MPAFETRAAFEGNYRDMNIGNAKGNHPMGLNGQGAERIEEWAKTKGYSVVRCEYRMLRRGPFFWAATNMQTVYWVLFKDKKGTERGAYVCLGGAFIGHFSNRMEVRWVKPAGR